MDRQILVNCIQTPDGTKLYSRHRHDYVTYIDKNDKEYMVDGGLDYLRRNIHDDAPFTELSLYEDDAFDILRNEFAWGTRGKDGRQPLTYKVLSSLEDDHIQAILDTQHHIPMFIKNLFELEQQWRSRYV
tara:strand:- start:238 stop:627 length:390 start_codon:yes stop_codon:yes gene_type:complete